MSRESIKRKKDEKASRRHDGKRKKLIVIVTAATCIIVITIIAVIASLPRYVKITVDGDWYVDEENGVRYVCAPINYEPVSYTKKAYAKCEGTYLYPITGKLTSQWLTEAYEGIGSVYYSEETELPDLAGFSACQVQVCTVSDKTVRVANIEDAEDVALIVSDITQGELVELPLECISSYHLKISSSEFSWLYYDLLYIITEDGRYYYDRGTQRSVDAGSLVYSYLNNSNRE